LNQDEDDSNGEDDFYDGHKNFKGICIYI